MSQLKEPTWRRAERCEGGSCVEIGTLGEFILVRSSADADGIYLTVSREEWQEFVTGVKHSDFDGL